MSDPVFEHFGFADEYGPEKVVTVYEPRCGLQGIVVIDNSAAGPTMGGIRMAADVSVEEVCRLARAMTWKNAMARLRHGGGKAGIRADPRSPNREALVRQFGRAIRQLADYIRPRTWARTRPRWPGFATRAASRSACPRRWAGSLSTRSVPPVSAWRSPPRWPRSGRCRTRRRHGRGPGFRQRRSAGGPLPGRAGRAPRRGHRSRRHDP